MVPIIIGECSRVQFASARSASMYGVSNNNKNAYRMFACAYALATIILLWLHVIVKRVDRRKEIAAANVPDLSISTGILVDTIET